MQEGHQFGTAAVHAARARRSCEQTQGASRASRTGPPVGKRGARLAAVSLALSLAQAASASTYTVGPGQNFPTPAAIDWSRISPGDEIVILAGTYGNDGKGNSLTIDGVSGTPSSRIVIRAASTANRPVFTQGIEVTTSSRYVTLSGFDVSRPATQPWAAVVVQGQSSDIRLSDLKVHDAFVGVNFAHAGVRNVIDSSEIYGNVHQGIGVTGTPAGADASNRSRISGNYVRDNGGHGLEITGSYWRVERNAVARNGSGYGGTSGIHVFSDADNSPSTCAHNEIVYNYAFAQQDDSQADGNGIQIDHFCDDNVVAFNVAWSNAGAGISLFAGKRNHIYANTLRGNATDQNRAPAGAWRGELILASAENVCGNSDLSGNCLYWLYAPAGRSSGNVIYDNIVVSLQNAVPAIHATRDFVNPSRNTNHLYPNMYFNMGSGPALRWGSQDYFSAAQIDTVTGLSSGGNIVELPSFLDVTSPHYGADGLRLTAKPGNEGWVVLPQVKDMSGAYPVSGSSYYGAYYRSPH